MTLQRTLAIVKPHAVRHVEAIVEAIEKAGFTVLDRRRTHLTPELASDLYAEHFGKENRFITSLITIMTSGPVVALLLAKSEDTVNEFRQLIGPTDVNLAKTSAPTSLRARFGTIGPGSSYSPNPENGLHGSDTPDAASREIRFFFPNAVMEPLKSAAACRDYVNKNINPTLLSGLTALVKAKPEEPLRFLAEWLLSNNPNKPNVTLVDEPED